MLQVPLLQRSYLFIDYLSVAVCLSFIDWIFFFLFFSFFAMVLMIVRPDCWSALNFHRYD